VNANTTMGGCNNRQFGWCSDLKQINVWVYYVLMFICVGVAFPTINVTLITLFSRMIGPRIQSRQQGTMDMFGGVGRLLGPILIGFDRARAYWHLGTIRKEWIELFQILSKNFLGYNFDFCLLIRII
jgi:MFS family permease